MRPSCMDGFTFYGISVATAGPALGHDMMVDDVTLLQAEAAGQKGSPVKVFTDHVESIESLIGFLTNFRIVEDQLRADFEVMASHPKAEFYRDILQKAPKSLGFSMSFSGQPDEVDGTRFARVSELVSVDLVSRPAANPDGIFRAGSEPKIDMGQQGMTENQVIAPAPEVAPEAPVVEEKLSVESDIAEIKAALASLKAAVDAIVAKEAMPEVEVESEDMVKKAMCEQPSDEITGLKAKVADLEIALAAKGAEAVSANAVSTEDPVEQFRMAAEAKDWKRVTELYAKHRNEILRGRK